MCVMLQGKRRVALRLPTEVQPGMLEIIVLPDLLGFFAVSDNGNSIKRPAANTIHCGEDQ